MCVCEFYSACFPRRNGSGRLGASSWVEPDAVKDSMEKKGGRERGKKKWRKQDTQFSPLTSVCTYKAHTCAHTIHSMSGLCAHTHELMK